MPAHSGGGLAPIKSWAEIQKLGQIKSRGEDMILLIDRWAALGDEHQMQTKTEHDPWPRTTCWTRFTARCSCGVHYPTVSATDTEIRNEAYLGKYVDTLRTASHLKHRIQELLGEEWTLS